MVKVQGQSCRLTSGIALEKLATMARKPAIGSTVLFLHDRQTKAVHAIPALQKAGSSLTHLVTEASRFVLWDRPSVAAAQMR